MNPALQALRQHVSGKVAAGEAEPIVALARCRCGQLGADGRCPACAARERAPQGQAVRLFEPAPAQIPGQLDLSMPPVSVAEANAEVRAMVAAARDEV